MARRKKKLKNTGTAWLVTFSDLMTLIMTFFVLLISMSVVDARRVQAVMNNVRGTSGMGPAFTTPLASQNISKPVTPGAFELPVDELEPLREMLWENQNKDLTLQSNRFVIIISINADVLFKPGETTLAKEGVALLQRLTPVLKNLNYPMLLAGHSSPERDEIKEYRVNLDPYAFSSTWEISFGRIMSVYALLKREGIAEDKMLVEAFGEYRPKVSNNTAPGRAANRRVDIVLDRRDKGAPLPDALDAAKQNPTSYEQKGFTFDVTPPPAGESRE